MGYYDDQSGILRRYGREKQGWDIHLQNTRQFVLQSALSKNRQSCIILGSGWLLDVPLDELSHLFASVTLADVRHPAPVRRKAKELGNVQLITCDISGFIEPVYHYARQYRYKKSRPPLDSIVPTSLPDLNIYDFVCSCNIINQLDILLVDYLLQFFDLEKDELRAFREKVQAYHIKNLPVQHSCIVADYEEKIYSPDNQLIERNISVYHPITTKPDARRWTWIFDTAMTYHAGKKTTFEVLAREV
jgi:hypothetical protein